MKVFAPPREAMKIMRAGVTLGPREKYHWKDCVVPAKATERLSRFVPILIVPDETPDQVALDILARRNVKVEPKRRRSSSYYKENNV